MALRDLQEFVAALEGAGELSRVRAEVDPHLEITEIADRCVKQGGPALLFERVKGSAFPVLINAFATRRRICLALGVERLEEIADRIEALLHLKPPEGLLQKLKMLPALAELGSFAPKVVRSAPCQEVVEERPSFDALPILTCWPGDAGRYVTLPLVVTRDPRTGMRNVGLYRVQVLDGTSAALHWQIHKDGARHWQDAKEARAPMEVAICLGADPATMYAASAPLPPDVEEYLFAGFLRRGPVELVKARTLDLEVPAHAEFVLEGTVDPDDLVPEGPFGDHTGFYTPVEPYPRFRLRAVTRRARPVYPTTVVGRPPMEDVWLGKATERIFLPLVRAMLPEIVDMSFPAEGIFNNVVVVSIRKRYPGHARKVMHAVWGLGQLMFTKFVIVVDHDVDVHDAGQVCWLTGTNVDPERDCEIVRGPVDTLNHASPFAGYGSKMGIDATAKREGEGTVRPWPGQIRMSPDVVARVTARWSEYGLPPLGGGGRRGG